MGSSSPDTGAAVERLLVFGDVSRQYSVAPQRDIPFVVARLEPAADTAPQAVEYLRAADTASPAITVVPAIGPTREVQLAEVAPTWSGHHAGDALVQALRDMATTMDGLAPLMVLRVHRGDGDWLVEVLPSTRLREVGAVFARVARFTTAAGTPIGELLGRAIEESATLRANIITEWQGWHNFEEGTEIEAKICLNDPVSIWSLSSAIAPEIGGPRFPGFIPDVGNEMQRWEFTQRSFEVLAPADEVGYIAFVTHATGTYLRQKKFAQEGLRRIEIIRSKVPADDPAAFLAAEYPDLQVRELPGFTRVRFDVNVESVVTGHFFGIEIDEVTEHDHGNVLRQVEVEYHRSRLHEGLDGSLIDGELQRLVGLVETYLDGRGIACERNYYSKLSFLRDCVDGSLAATVGRG